MAALIRAYNKFKKDTKVIITAWENMCRFG